MATQNKSPITFVVPGDHIVDPSALRGSGTAPGAPGRAAEAEPWDVVETVALGQKRSGGAPRKLTAVPGEHIVRIQIAGGPELILHPENARDLMIACAEPLRSGGAPALAKGEVAVPPTLRWQALESATPTRAGGFLGRVVMSMFQLLRPKVPGTAAKLIAQEVVKQVDGQVAEGVYRLQRHTLDALSVDGAGDRRQPGPLHTPQVPAPPPGAANAAILVLVHGTFVDTVSTFGKLWKQHPQSVQALFNFYGDRVYALDHATLGASPLANALGLARALPHGARLHLLTHSRGGLVAECLARACHLARHGGVGPGDLGFFPGAPYEDHRADLEKLVAEAKARDLAVDRIVRVACPARGTLLASGRLDAYLSVLSWALKASGVPLAPVLLNFIAEVARRRANPAELPGLEAMIPDTQLLQ
jgi:hypothetical protein